MPPVPWDAGDVSAADALLAAAIRPPSGHRAGTLERVSHHRSITAATARRFLVRRHLLAPPRSLPPEPASVMRVIDRLGSLQFDPLEVAGRNHDLTLLARVAGYRRTWTDGLLYRDRVLYETFNKMLSLVPTAELPWYRITWDRMHAEHTGGPFDEHAPLVEELLARIRADGPLSSTDVKPRAAIDWYWRPTNQVRAILEALGEAGILAIERREGNRRVYDLAERLFPAELLAQHRPEREQRRHKLLSRYRGNGLLGVSGDYSIWAGTGDAAMRTSLRDELVATGAIVPVAVEGLKGPRFVVGDEVPLLNDAEAEAAAGGPMRGAGAAFLLPRPAGLGPGPAAPPLGVRLPVGGLRPGREAPLGLLRAAAALRRPVRRAHRAADRPQDRDPAHPRAVVGGGVRAPVRGKPGLPRCLHRGDPGAHGVR